MNAFATDAVHMPPKVVLRPFPQRILVGLTPIHLERSSCRSCRLWPAQPITLNLLRVSQVEFLSKHNRHDRALRGVSFDQYTEDAGSHSKISCEIRRDHQLWIDRRTTHRRIMRCKFAEKPGQIESTIDLPNKMVFGNRVVEVKLIK